MKLLLIEDEIKTSNTIKQGLEENNYHVDVAPDGLVGLQMVQKNEYDLLITDIIMPNLNGLEFCQKVRQSGNSTPIIMLTALSMTADKIKGFDAGTDDYLVKPFEFSELLARIKALLKRSKYSVLNENILSFADIVINMDTREVERSGKQIKLTAKEFALLVFFIQNKGRVISKTDIAEQVWDINFNTGTNFVEVYVNYLRNKIDKDFETKLIHTRIGMGYVLKLEN
jgi:two-component system copper resistance phosphate regulon response regulator CusR